MTAGVAQGEDMPRAKRNVLVLAAMHAVLGSQLAVYMILGGLAGATLAPSPGLATLPIAVQMIAAMITAAPLSMLMAKLGRRPGFFLGAAAGIAGSALAVLGLMHGSFAFLLAGHAGAGIYQASQNYFRFAAADAAPDHFKPKAISLVLGGGLVAALIGPEIVVRASEMLAPIPFAGAYLTLILVNILGMCIIPLLDAPKPVPATPGTEGRPLREILAQPIVRVAIICAVVSYAMMTLVMTSTPLAVVACGFANADAADVVRWHVVAMFAPSFFTGSLIARFGHGPIIGLGLAMLATCAVIALSGIDLANFYAALVLLGLGWNFGFIGATSLLTKGHRPEERGRVQGFNDFVVMSFVAAAALSSGAFLSVGGWSMVNYAVFPAVLIAGGALIWLALLKPRAVSG